MRSSSSGKRRRDAAHAIRLSDRARAAHQLATIAAPPMARSTQNSGSDAGRSRRAARVGRREARRHRPSTDARRSLSDSSRKFTPSSNSTGRLRESASRPPGDGATNSSWRPAGRARSTRAAPNTQRTFRIAPETHAHPFADAVVPAFRTGQALPAHLDEVRDEDRPVGRPNQIRAIEIEVEEDRRVGRCRWSAACRSGRSPADASGRTGPAASGTRAGPHDAAQRHARSSGWRFSSTNGPMKSCGAPGASHARRRAAEPDAPDARRQTGVECRRVDETPDVRTRLRVTPESASSALISASPAATVAQAVLDADDRGRGSTRITSLSRTSASSDSATRTAGRPAGSGSVSEEMPGGARRALAWTISSFSPATIR